MFTVYDNVNERSAETFDPSEGQFVPFVGSKAEAEQYAGQLNEFGRYGKYGWAEQRFHVKEV